jgi:hypothetical protein
MEAGDLATARDLLEESLQLHRKLDLRPGITAALLALADVTNRAGATEKARTPRRGGRRGDGQWCAGVLS